MYQYIQDWGEWVLDGIYSLVEEKQLLRHDRKSLQVMIQATTYKRQDTLNDAFVWSSIVA
jgi:hypothetical protein